MSDMTYKSDDLLKTSTGIGHYWRRDQPDSEVELFQTRSLPEILNKPPEVASGDHYQTTSRTVHNYKCSLQNYGYGTSFTKPPAHYKVHYNKDLHDKLQSERLRRPLTMGNQASETREEFILKIKPFETNKFSELNGFLLKDHLKDASHSPHSEKIGLPSSLMTSNNSIYILNDPYMTTYQKEHRAYKPNEVIAKYNWDPIMVQSHESPMRDKSFCKSATKIRQLPHCADFVPHSGMKTEYRENFDTLLDLYNSEAPQQINANMEIMSKPANPAYFVPRLYKTEYSTIGSKCKDVI